MKQEFQSLKSKMAEQKDYNKAAATALPTRRHRMCNFSVTAPGEGERERGILPDMCYIGMCSPKEYGFSAVLVINKLSILADFGHSVINRVWFMHSSLDIFKKKPLFHHY